MSGSERVVDCTCGAEYFEMLYCDKAACQVNTFEHFEDGQCPGCGAHGLPG